MLIQQITAKRTNLVDGRTLVHGPTSYRDEIAKLDAVKVCSEHSVRHLAGPCAPLFEAIGLVDLDKL